jgi:hypothetical protein
MTGKRLLEIAQAHGADAYCDRRQWYITRDGRDDMPVTLKVETENTLKLFFEYQD